MLGLMMQTPLLLSSILTHAAPSFPDVEIISRTHLAMAHPEIAEAAVIGIAHPKWDERPLVLAVRRQGSRLKAQDLLAFCEGKIAKWWMPTMCCSSTNFRTGRPERS
jgi:AMP-binding enzyme C-terminal domain